MPKKNLVSKMKNIGSVFSFILSKEVLSIFERKSDHYLILLPLSFLTKLGFEPKNQKFELILDKKYLSLRLALPPGMTDKDLKVLQDE